MVRLRLRPLLSAGRHLAPVLAAAALARAAGAQARPADPPNAARAEAAVVVVANTSMGARALARDEVRRIFLLRTRYASDGTRLRPVNLPAAAPLRDLFSRRVLGRPARDFAGYWNDLYFHGTEPPPTLASEQAVLLYVARTPGAIGYVSAESAATLPEGVKVVMEVR